MEDLTQSRFRFVHAEPSETRRAVIYRDEDGNEILRAGGNRPWRNHNPGNLFFSGLKAARAAGALGTDLDGFGIFPDVETGQRALSNFLSQENLRVCPETLSRIAELS